MTTDSSTADVVHGMILERQRLLIREANYLRSLVNLPPVDGVAVADDERSAVGDTPRLIELTPNRRAVIASVARCVTAGEAPTHTVLTHRSGLSKRAMTRVLAWAVSSCVVSRTATGYLPGSAWAECVDSDAELLGLD